MTEESSVRTSFGEVVAYVEKTHKPEVFDIDDRSFTSRQVYNVPEPVVPEIRLARALEVSSMESMLTYITAVLDQDTDDERNGHLLHVKSSTDIKLWSTLNERRERELLLCASWVPLGLDAFLTTYHDLANWIVLLRTTFADGEIAGDFQRLVDATSKITAESVREDLDDGFSQQATARAGVDSSGWANLPKTVHLTPLGQTFPGIEMPERQFFVRARGGGEGAGTLALFEIETDWESVVCKMIAGWFRAEMEKMPDLVDIPVLY